MPLLMILIFGYTFGGDVSNISIELVVLDEGHTSDSHLPLNPDFSMASSVIKEIDDTTFSINKQTDPDIAQQMVRMGNAWAAVVFPVNFTENFLNYIATPQKSWRPTVEIYLDASNPTIASTVIKTISGAIQTAISKLAVQLNLSQIEIPISIESNYIYGGGDTRFIDYFAPGVICFAIMMVTTMITIILFVNERRNGTLQRLLASPSSEVEIVVGYALAFSIIGICQSIVVLVTAILLFGITIVGNIIFALFVILLLAFGHQGLGILLSAGAKNELQAIQFIPLIIFPSVLLAGLFWPIESIPSYLQPLSYFIPLRYGIDAERAIMLRGWGLGEVWIDVVILILFAFLTLAGSVMLLKRRE
jgi:ABC-2 type transport system permease protein